MQLIARLPSVAAAASSSSHSQTVRVQRPAAHSRLPAQPLTRTVNAWSRQSRLHAAVTSQGVGQAAAADLAKQLLQAEQELQAMFQPGKPMPKAAVVAAKRGEVARLRAQLEGRMSTLEEDTQDPEEVEAARQAFEEARVPGASGGGRASMVGHGEDALAAEAAARADQAVDQLEQYLRGPLVNDDDEKLSQLESENAQLRIMAHQLLLRQQQLEELAMEHGIPVPGMEYEEEEA